MNHYESIKESVKYIEDHLFDHLSPKTLSERAYISEFYYFRLFKSIVGTSVMDYILKRRLSESMSKWVKGKEKVNLLAVALDTGYSSQSAFTRSFRKAFNMTPRHYLKQHLQRYEDALFPPFTFWGIKSMDTSQVFDTNYNIVELDEITLVGMSRNTTLNQNRNYVDVYDMIEQLTPFWESTLHHNTKYPIDTGVVDNCHIDPHLPDNVDFTYFRGFDVTSLKEQPGQLKTKTIAKKKYLKFRTTGNEDTYETTLDFIFRHVLIENNEQLDNEDITLIEKFRYDDVYDEHYIGVDIYIPIL